jgi:hypothetical protein
MIAGGIYVRMPKFLDEHQSRYRVGLADPLGTAAAVQAASGIAAQDIMPLFEQLREQESQRATFRTPQPPLVQGGAKTCWRWSRGSKLVTGSLGSVFGGGRARPAPAPFLCIPRPPRTSGWRPAGTSRPPAFSGRGTGRKTHNASRFSSACALR